MRGWPTLNEGSLEDLAGIQAASEVLDRPIVPLVREALRVEFEGLDTGERQAELIEEGSGRGTGDREDHGAAR